MKSVALALTLAGSALAVPTYNSSIKHCTGECQSGPDPNSRMPPIMRRKMAEQAACDELSILTDGKKGCPTKKPDISNVPCTGGQAGEYACSNVDLNAFISVADMDSPGTNDIWGWTDPEGGNEIALVALREGTAFVDVTTPSAPVVLGKMMGNGAPSSWRDIKVFRDTAYVGSEANGHGMQIFDLKTLRPFYGQDSRGPSIHLFEPTNIYTEFGSSHNIVLNEATGYLYAVGSTTCSAGPHMVELNTDPLNPQFVGCIAADGYTHDAECVVYTGPDTEFQGHEICFAYNENTLTIWDVRDHLAPEMLSRETYDNVYYTHQGWLTEDQTHLFLDDELDESNGPTPNTRTLIWDVRSLRNPVLHDSFFSEETVIDHNLYVKGDYIFQSNYCAGLQILHMEMVGEHPVLTRAGYFDNAPDCSTPTFSGSWSNYPYFASGTVIFTSIERGLYIVDPSAALAQPVSL